jgi:hypothetical protein
MSNLRLPTALHGKRKGRDQRYRNDSSGSPTDIPASSNQVRFWWNNRPPVCEERCLLSARNRHQKRAYRAYVAGVCNVPTTVISVARVCRARRAIMGHAIIRPIHGPSPAAGTGSAIHFPTATCFFTSQVVMSSKFDEYFPIGLQSGGCRIK